MTDFLSDTPSVARVYCPTCEPDTDPRAEVLDVRYCPDHTPAWNGADDSTVRAEGYLSGSAEAGGANNREWCDLFHRKRRLLTGGAR